MKLTSLGLVSFLASILATSAAAPPERLLSSETWAVFSVPDVQQAKGKISNWPMVRMWRDPAMKAFRDKFTTKFNSEVVEKMEKETGAKLSDYVALAQGQLTVAVTPGTFNGKDGIPGFVVILDAKDKNEALQTQLTQLKKKWVEKGNKVRVEKIRDVEFSGIIIDEGDAEKDKAKPPADDAGEKPTADSKDDKLELLIGQSESLLIVGNTAKDIEKVLIRQSGGSVPSLAEESTFASSYSSTLRESVAFGWINLRKLVELATKMAASSSPDSGADFMGMKPDKMIGALGLQGLDSLAFGLKDTPDGAMSDVSLNIPAAKRRGIFKLLTVESLESSPPAFVPADALKFRRVRVDIPKLWNNLETMVNEVSPQIAGVFRLLVDNAGKDKDPQFDLRKSVIANLGNDVITYSKGPRAQTLEAIVELPQLYLVGSPQPEQLAAALKAIGSFLPSQDAVAKEREFLGRKVYSLPLPANAQGGRRLDRTLHYAASGSYVAISMDETMLEEFLRSSATPGKSLRETAGLAAAAEKVGGMGTGLFAYENYKDSMRHTFAILKKEAEVGNLFSNSPLAGKVSDDDLKQWIDLSLLPDFDKIAKYFSFSVNALSVNNDGLRMKSFMPNPPQMGK